jgi:acyl carrier protein
MKTPSREDILSQVDDLFVELFELERERLKPECHLFSDLGLDSLDAIDLVVSFERVFKIRPPHAEIREIRTLSDVHDLVLKYHGALSNDAATVAVAATATVTDGAAGDAAFLENRVAN